MKTVHVTTRKVAGHDEDGNSVFATTKHKRSDLGPFGPFASFLKNLNLNRFKKIEVVGVYDSETDKVSVTDEDIEFYQKQIDEVKSVKTPEKIDYKALSEKQAKHNSALEDRLKSLEDMIQAGSKKEEVDPDEDYKKELREKIKYLGGKTQGLKTIESLEAKIEYLKNPEV